MKVPGLAPPQNSGSCFSLAQTHGACDAAADGADAGDQPSQRRPWTRRGQDDAEMTLRSTADLPWWAVSHADAGVWSKSSDRTEATHCLAGRSERTPARWTRCEA